jgi:hypothetical protein
MKIVYPATFLSSPMKKFMLFSASLLLYSVDLEGLDGPIGIIEPTSGRSSSTGPPA